MAIKNSLSCPREKCSGKYLQVVTRVDQYTKITTIDFENEKVNQGYSSHLPNRTQRIHEVPQSFFCPSCANRWSWDDLKEYNEDN